MLGRTRWMHDVAVLFRILEAGRTRSGATHAAWAQKFHTEYVVQVATVAEIDADAAIHLISMIKLPVRSSYQRASVVSMQTASWMAASWLTWN